MNRGFALIICLLLIGLLPIVQVGCGGGTPPFPQFIEIDAPGAGSTLFLGTTAQDINANGDIAGFYTDANNASHGFVRTSGQALTVFDAPGAGTTGDQGTDSQGINSVGTIVGSVIDQAFVSHGYIRTSGGIFTVFDVPGSSGTFVYGINDGGMVTGKYLDGSQFAHGYVRASDGTFTMFDPPGTTFEEFLGTIPARISSSGAVVGSFQGAGGVLHGFLRAPDGTITTFDAPGAANQDGAGTLATDINETGVIVGLLYGPLFNGSGHRSFVRDAAGNITVFDPPGVGPPPPGNGGTGSAASGINSNGTVVGTFTDPNNLMHGYIRNPDGTFVIIDDPNASTTGNTALGTNVNHVNSAGIVVGVYFDLFRARHGFARG